MWQVLEISGWTLGSIVLVAMVVAAAEWMRNGVRQHQYRQQHAAPESTQPADPPTEPAPRAASMMADTLLRVARSSALSSADAAARRGQGPSWAETLPMVISAAEAPARPSAPPDINLNERLQLAPMAPADTPAQAAPGASSPKPPPAGSAGRAPEIDLPQG